jgi:hypothetical protein
MPALSAAQVRNCHFFAAAPSVGSISTQVSVSPQLHRGSGPRRPPALELALCRIPELARYPLRFSGRCQAWEKQPFAGAGTATAAPIKGVRRPNLCD